MVLKRHETSQCQAIAIKKWNTIILLDITLQFNSKCENITVFIFDLCLSLVYTIDIWNRHRLESGGSVWAASKSSSDFWYALFIY